MTIKELRKTAGLTQVEAATLTGIPLRTYKLYETDRSRVGTIKYNHIRNILEVAHCVDETHGILKQEFIKEQCLKVLSSYEIEFCYLFGSYASGKANECSDVNLLVSGNILGKRFYILRDELSSALRKRICLINVEQLAENPVLIKDILKCAVRIC